MEQRYPWQSAVLASLVAARGLKLNAGSLFANVMDQIPIHHGGRAANRHRVTDKEGSKFLSATELRWAAFRQYVLSLDVKTEPPVTASTRGRLTMRHHIQAQLTYCPACGEEYIGRKGRPEQGHPGCKPKPIPAPTEQPSAALGRVVYLDQYRRRA